MDKETFINEIAKYVQGWIQAFKFGVPSAIIAQACLESAFGTSDKALRHNYFGLKFRMNRVQCNSGVFTDTSYEQKPDGQYVPIVTQWYSFPDMNFGVEGYFQFIDSGNYGKAKSATTPESYLQALKDCGYATSINYVQNLLNVIDKYDLRRFDGMNADSLLVKGVIPSPNYSKRKYKIDTIIIHCMAGTYDAKRCGQLFADPKRQASSHYGISSNGDIYQYVPEQYRAWTTGGDKVCNGWTGSDYDHRSITMEVSNTTLAPDYQVSPECMASIINLCADICRRNGIKELKWSNNPKLVGNADLQNMAVHRWFASKSCVPINTEVLTRTGWMKIGDVEIGDEIACADLDNLKVTFEEVYDKVPVKTQDTYTSNGLTATKDHRMVYKTHLNNEWRIDHYNNVLAIKHPVYIPMAGYANNDGLNISNEMLAFLVAVQADGHYMKDSRMKDDGIVGLEFHLKKERKIERIKYLLDELKFEYRCNPKSDDSVSIRVYGKEIVEKCEEYLDNKRFTWEWLKMSKEQADFFIEELQLWDGCQTANLYTSKDRINLDVVSAICATNGIGSKVTGDNIAFRENPYITLGEAKRNNSNKDLTTVTCVSVKTGIFLCRQNGKTFVIGNCPGNFLMMCMPNIALAVNQQLVTPQGYILNGYDYSPVFDPVFYTERYSDLNAAFGYNSEMLWLHFQTCGMNEFRQASAEFDPVVYAERYPDVKEAFGDDRPMYYFHYIAFGIDEGRSGI